MVALDDVVGVAIDVVPRAGNHVLDDAHVRVRSVGDELRGFGLGLGEGGGEALPGR